MRRTAGDPARWLALEVASHALTDAGFPGGKGLDRDRVTVVMGNTLTGEVSGPPRCDCAGRTCAACWSRPWLGFPRRRSPGCCPARGASIYGRSPRPPRRAWPEACPDLRRPLDHFDLRGGGYVVDGAGASSLLAVITACRSLLDGSADFALAGGVDLSLDPFELVGLAKTGALAEERMRIYDTRSNGFWPGEGCGIVALMPTTGARAAGVRIYAEIAGWGVSSDGGGRGPSRVRPRRRGHGPSGVRRPAPGPDPPRLRPGRDLPRRGGPVRRSRPRHRRRRTAELTALTRLLSGTVRQAALGSVAANIGHTKAAAGAAGLIKATLSIASGVLPPTTGCGSPHSLLTAPGAPLRVLDAPESWPSGPRHAGVSATGFRGDSTPTSSSPPRLRRR